MRYYLKSGKRAALRAFRTGNMKEADEIPAENERILVHLWNELASEKIDGFYQQNGGKLVLWTRSLYPNVTIQETHFVKREWGLLPDFHSNENGPEDLLREHGYIEGAYIQTNKL